MIILRGIISQLQVLEVLINKPLKDILENVLGRWWIYTYKTDETKQIKNKKTIAALMIHNRDSIRPVLSHRVGISLS